MKQAGEIPFLEVVVDRGPSVFGFADESFRFAGYDPDAESLSFADASGHYRLSLKAVLGTAGNLSRDVPNRLEVTAP